MAEDAETWETHPKNLTHKAWPQTLEGLWNTLDYNVGLAVKRKYTNERASWWILFPHNQQLFLEYFLCTRPCSRYWEYSGIRTNQVLPPRAYTAKATALV